MGPAFPRGFLGFSLFLTSVGLLCFGGKGSREAGPRSACCMFLILPFADIPNPSVSRAPTASVQLSFHKARSALSKWLLVQAGSTGGQWARGRGPRGDPGLRPGLLATPAEGCGPHLSLL